MNKLLTVEEAIKFLQVSKPTIYRLTSKKKIPFFKIGCSVRFSETHLLAWLEKHGVMPREGVENDRAAI
ncbi:MAG: helix-turn-helix domain-containing protein [Sphaerochaeta sp.]|nr:helix-turn-helix domain-containing protein [Sphaerochaeta sp.]